MFVFAGALQGSRIRLEGIFRQLSLRQILKLLALDPLRLLPPRQQSISIGRNIYLQERHKEALTKRSSASFKSASSCWARWARTCWSFLFASSASCASCFVDFILPARISGVWAEVSTKRSKLTFNAGGQRPWRFWHRAADANYWHVIQFFCYDCQLVSFPSKTMANASGKRIGKLVIYCIGGAHEFLHSLSSEPKWEHSQIPEARHDISNHHFARPSIVV